MQRDLKNLHLRRNKFKFEKYIRSFDREKERLVSNELHHVDGTRGWLAVGQDPPSIFLDIVCLAYGDMPPRWESIRSVIVDAFERRPEERNRVAYRYSKNICLNREREKRKRKTKGMDGREISLGRGYVNILITSTREYSERADRNDWFPFVASRIIRAEEHIFPRSEELSRFSKRTFPSFRFSIC